MKFLFDMEEFKAFHHELHKFFSIANDAELEKFKEDVMAKVFTLPPTSVQQMQEKFFELLTHHFWETYERIQEEENERTSSWRHYHCPCTPCVKYRQELYQAVYGDDDDDDDWTNNDDDGYSSS